MSQKFRGFPPEALVFYERLEADNTRPFWAANKADYHAHIRDPFDQLIAELEPEYGTFRTFRPFNDVRFSKDKTPYKTHTGTLAEGEGGTMYYLQLSANGLLVGSGYHYLAADQLTRFREALDDDILGPRLERLLAPLLERGYGLSAASELKTAPRGYPKDHPRIELLRRKGLTVTRSFPPAKWLHTAAAKQRVVGVWNDAAPVSEWLDQHVGPSHLPPDDRHR